MKRKTTVLCRLSIVSFQLRVSYAEQKTKNKTKQNKTKNKKTKQNKTKNKTKHTQKTKQKTKTKKQVVYV